MDLQTVIQLISNLGFPIVCCVGLFWYITKMTAQHKEETDKLREAISNNTIVMQKLIDMIEGEEK